MASLGHQRFAGRCGGQHLDRGASPAHPRLASTARLVLVPHDVSAPHLTALDRSEGGAIRASRLGLDAERVTGGAWSSSTARACCSTSTGGTIAVVEAVTAGTAQRPRARLSRSAHRHRSRARRVPRARPRTRWRLVFWRRGDDPSGSPTRPVVVSLARPAWRLEQQRGARTNCFGGRIALLVRLLLPRTTCLPGWWNCRHDRLKLC